MTQSYIEYCIAKVTFVWYGGENKARCEVGWGGVQGDVGGMGAVRVADVLQV